MQNVTYTFQNLQVPGCQKIVRKVILQLMMIQWGILGLGDASAGTFLANTIHRLDPILATLMHKIGLTPP